MSDPIDELKRTTCACDIDCLIAKDAILALASRIADLERTVAAYKEAVDMVTAWADGKDRQAYEKAIKEIPDKPDRAEIVERYIIQLRVLDPKSSGWKAMAVATLNDLIDEVTK